MKNQLTHTVRPAWCKSATQYFALFLIILLLPVTSYSQSYQVDFGGGFNRTKEPIDKTEETGLATAIYFEEVETGSHPYQEAAFLEHTSSLTFLYLDTEDTSTLFDADGTEISFLINYIEPNSLHIFQFGYDTSDIDIKNGFNGTGSGDAITLGIGTYINSHSVINASYSQIDVDVNIAGFPASSSKISNIEIEYKLVEELQNDKAYNFEASIASFKNDDSTTIETNTTVSLEGDYYFNQSTSVGVSIEKNQGDDKFDEGITLGLNINLFLTKSFAIFGGYEQFSADNVFSVDSDEVFFGGKVRF